MAQLGDICSNIKNGTVSNSALEVELECSSAEEYTYLKVLSANSENRRVGISGDFIFFSNSIRTFYNYLYTLRLSTNTLRLLYDFTSEGNAVTGYSTCVVGGYVYIISNYSFSKINLTTEIKTTISTSSSNCSSFSSLIVDGVYVHNITHNPFTYNTETGEFEAFKFTSMLNKERTAVAISDTYIYTVGGNLTTMAIVEKINIETGETTILDDIPEEFTYGGASVMNGYLWAYGGSLGNKIYKMDLETETWELHSSVLPVSNSHFGYCEKDGWIYMVGGTAQEIYKMRFGLDSENIEIRYNITSDGTEPEEPTETTGTVYTAPITVSETGKYNLKAVSFEKV